MTRCASQVIDDYLSVLRSELAGAGVPDTDDVVAEIRSMLVEAAGDDPEAAAAQTVHLGEPAELARNILAERGLEASSGMPSGVWWRLGLAAPIDLVIGLSLPLAAALPLFAFAAFGEPRAVRVAVAVVLGVATLLWPFFVWRPWRRGGRTLSPGMTLTGLAVVRAPGFWRLVPIDELEDMGLAPRRRFGLAVVVTLVALAVIAAGVAIGLDIAMVWVVAGAVRSESPLRPVTGLGEPNDDRAHATLLLPGQQVDASLETTSDIDVYRIERYGPARAGTIRMLGRIEVRQTDAAGREIGATHADEAPREISEEALSTVSSLNLDPSDAQWPLYVEVRRAAGYTGRADYRILMPRAR